MEGDPAEGTSLAFHFAHDIRSPVAAITLLTEVLRDELGPSVEPRHRRRLDLLYWAAQSFNALVEDLLTLSGQASEVDGGTHPFHVDELMDAVLEALRPSSELWEVPIHVSSSVIGQRSGHVAGLHHTLLNLALLLQSTGEDQVEIHAEGMEGSRVRFSVSTPGRGPDPASLRTVREVAAGSEIRSPACFSHLGTEVAFRLVGAMGSRLEVETPEAGGTRFWFDTELPGPMAGDGR